MRRLLLTIGILIVSGNSPAAYGDDRQTNAVDVATFDEHGRLVLPADIDEWIFLGSSLGMGYSQETFDPGSPGMFQIVRMEPRAYRVFRETGRFPDGTMIALHFFGTENNISINRAGFVMGSQHLMEIHYKDSRRFPDGFNFYTFQNDDTFAGAIPLPNDCVACHKKDGAYDAVFVQFYPTIHEYLPADVRERLPQTDNHSGH
jgi:hypothetical protein